MGEFNVDKTTGGLNPTAGIPDTYPAEQVMMSDGVTSVEDKIGNVRMTKLWENPSPTSNFVAQDIAIDLSGYDLILILTKAISTISINEVGKEINLNEAIGGAVGITNRRRLGIVTSTGITLNDAYKSSSFSTGSIDNSLMIPLVIYGIKLT